ncbi:MAG TPA: DinB family protein [Terracidiphilus sp.]|nr:DinB family protein [Terracidiphilus sp.]
MPSAKLILLDDFKYSEWATRRLLTAAAALTPEERLRNLGLSHRSVLETLHHIFLSEQLWSECLIANALPPMHTIGRGAPPPIPPLEILAAEWVRLTANARTWLAALPEDALDATLASELAPGGAVAHLARWQILRHTINHATLHRGQIISMLRMLGKQPPNVDVMTCCLERTVN